MQDNMQDNTPTPSHHPKRQWQVPQIRLLTASTTATGSKANILEGHVYYTVSGKIIGGYVHES